MLDPALLSSPAYRALRSTAKRMLDAIDTTMRADGTAMVSYESFRLDHGVGRQNIAKCLRTLEALGLIEIEIGVRCGNVFRMSDRWREIDEDEARRLVEQASVPTGVRRAALRQHEALHV